MDQDFQTTRVDLDADPAAARADARGWMARWLARLTRRQAAHRPPPRDLCGRQALLLEGGGALAGGAGALAVFDFQDLLELRDLYGPACAAEATARLVEALRLLAGEPGVVARAGATQFAVLLPRLDREAAIERAYAVLGRPCRLELDWGGDELVLVPDLAVDVCAGPAELGDLLERLTNALARHCEHEERRRRHLRRSRERHSRPMPV